MEYRLLGPLHVVADDGSEIAIGGNQRVVLAVLLLAEGRVVTVDRLADAVWGEDQPDDPAAAVRTQISRLRRRLGANAAALATLASGYQLQLGRRELDVARFEELLCADRLASGDALRVLDEALALWRGPALADFAGADFARPYAVRLEELRLVARERRGEALLAVGRIDDAVSCLDDLVREHPERERARGLLMEALYGAGRHTEALALYREWREHLGETLGLEPSPALKEIEEKVLLHTLPASKPATPAQSHRLPVPVSSFVGREDDVATLEALVGRARLVTLVGPGGVGKTRLALEVARRVAPACAAGAVFCDLSVVRQPSRLVRAVATAVGLEERAGAPVEEQLFAHVRGARLLVVLDNCEHLLDTVAPLAERLLALTDVDILATSHERLAVTGETVHRVEPLDAWGPGSPAVRLFLDRCAQADSAFALRPDDEPTLAKLCARLDGVPLAIELAAARLPDLGLHATVRALEDRFRFFTTGPRSNPRHRSLAAVVEWAHERLDESERDAFEKLGVFAGAFDLEAGAAVVGDAARVVRLAERSLLKLQRDAGEARYSMLETLRTYALERLASRDALDGGRDAHARWALGLAEDAAEGLGTADEVAWAGRVERHLDEMRAAHSWLVGRDVDRALRLSAALHHFAMWRNKGEVSRWAEVAAAAAAGRPPSEVLPVVLASVAIAAVGRGDFRAGVVGAAAAARAHAAAPSAAGRRAVLEAEGEVALLRGDLVRARDLYREAGEKSEHPLQAVFDLGSAALADGYAGRIDDALRTAEEVFQFAARGGSPTASAFASFVAGEITVDTDPDSAEGHLRQAAHLAAGSGARYVSGLAQVTLASLHARHRDPATALRYYRSAIGEWTQARAWKRQAVTVRSLVGLLARVGAWTGAALLYGAAVAPGAAPPFGDDLARLQRLEDQLRSVLGDSDFEALAGRGAELDGYALADAALVAIERALAAAERVST